MPEFTEEITVEFNVECRECGVALVTEESKWKGTFLVSVEPCETCLERARKEGDTQ
jgi:hypothetical protein